MVAMKAATERAGDMIKALTRQYNRARQTQITMELLDIVGGANALVLQLLDEIGKQRCHRKRQPRTK